MLITVSPSKTLDLDPQNEEAARALLEYTTDATIQFIRLMAATGAHMVSNGDSPAGPSVVSPRIYRSFALPYEERVVEADGHVDDVLAVRVISRVAGLGQLHIDALRQHGRDHAARVATLCADHPCRDRIAAGNIFEFLFGALIGELQLLKVMIQNFFLANSTQPSV